MFCVLNLFGCDGVLALWRVAAWAECAQVVVAGRTLSAAKQDQERDLELCLL